MHQNIPQTFCCILTQSNYGANLSAVLLGRCCTTQSAPPKALQVDVFLGEGGADVSHLEWQPEPVTASNRPGSIMRLPESPAIGSATRLCRR